MTPICRIPSLTEDAWSKNPDPRKRCVNCDWNRYWESLSFCPEVVREYCYAHSAPCKNFGFYCGAWKKRNA